MAYMIGATMRTFLITLITVLLTFGLAQQFHDAGIIIETDEFEGYTTCEQIVLDDGRGLSLVIDDRDFTLVAWKILVVGSIKDLPYNLFREVEGDRVLVKLGEDEPYNLDLLVYPVEFRDNLYYQELLIPVNTTFIEHVVRYPGEVRVRLDGSRGEVDFTFSDAARAAFSSRFFLDCVPASHGS